MRRRESFTAFSHEASNLTGVRASFRATQLNLTDQKQSRRVSGRCFGRAVDAGGNGSAGILNSDSPEIAHSEQKGARPRQRGVMQIVAVFLQVFGKVFVVIDAKNPEKLSANFGDVHVPLRLIIPEAFTRWAMVSAKPGISLHWGPVGVE
jgi:hypothetical protein